MCTNTVENFQSHPFFPTKRKQRSKRPKVQVLGLTRRRFQEDEGKDMELKNLKLYLENQSIVEENEKLRQKANVLHQENLALIAEFQLKFPHLDRFSAALVLLQK
ncbi:protein LITTLE ZIPPER 2-like [Mercurialis annua]|uniref:protein LITTLE ZIPPER 2-like n=1 Tax=Mercurialis annua TaxID=3986 RepID=UPI00215EB42C|nr:protein LITTLE ZIPPER 2-like [Mercurialis annua]